MGQLDALSSRFGQDGSQYLTFTLAGEEYGDRGADTRPAAGDHGDLLAQTEQAGKIPQVSSSVRLRAWHRRGQIHDRRLQSRG